MSFASKYPIIPISTANPVLMPFMVAITVSTAPHTVGKIRSFVAFWIKGKVKTTVIAPIIAPPSGVMGESGRIKNRMIGSLSDNKNGKTRDSAVKITITITAINSKINLSWSIMIYPLSRFWSKLAKNAPTAAAKIAICAYPKNTHISAISPANIIISRWLGFLW